MIIKKIFARLVLWIVGFFLSLSIYGCSQIRYYPFCVFGPDPKSRSDQALRKDIDKFIRAVVGDEAKIEFSPNERVVVVEALSEKQEELSKIWPRASCIGRTRYDEEYSQYKACVYLIEAGLKNSGIQPLGRWSDGIGNSTVYCGQNLSTSEK